MLKLLRLRRWRARRIRIIIFFVTYQLGQIMIIIKRDAGERLIVWLVAVVIIQRNATKSLDRDLQSERFRRRVGKIHEVRLIFGVVRREIERVIGKLRCKLKAGRTETSSIRRIYIRVSLICGIELVCEFSFVFKTLFVREWNCVMVDVRKEVAALLMTCEQVSGVPLK